MVRFCDKDIVSINYDSINRQELLRYFLRGHIDDMVCVFNADNIYMGNITYRSLLYNEDLEAAMDRGMLVLNEDIWTNAREMFENHRSYLDKHPLLPVVDAAGQLISFAYEDSDANRELRQLRELSEKSDAVQFRDMYPEYDCVIIYGFNELAYFFAGYLKEQGIPVRVEDAMWEGFFQSDETPFMEHRCMKIYAEGTWEKPSNWQENLLRSVSVEFECIDTIYEENIRGRFFRDVACSLEELLRRLRSAEAVALIGRDIAAQEACDFLVQNEIDVKCFVVLDGIISEQRIFGKPLCTLADVKKEYGNDIILIDNHWENSTWGIGEVDYFDYIGYRRNESLFLLRDYIKIQGNGLKAVLKDKQLVMTGDVRLCERLMWYFTKNSITASDNIFYMNLTGKEMPGKHVLHVLDEDEGRRDAICLLVLPQYREVGAEEHRKYQEKKTDLLSCIREKGFYDYTDYFSYTDVFINIEKENNNKYPGQKWKVRRIILGSIEPYSGNWFFGGLLDNHPDIMEITFESPLNMNIFWLCLLLADRETDEIISLLETLDCSKYSAHGLVDEEILMQRIKECLENGKKYTSQELFVIIHAALYGKCADDISSMIIYWEPHLIPRNTLERYTLWLGTTECPCDIVNVVRNTCRVRGTHLKQWERERFETTWNISKYKRYDIVTKYADIRKEEYVNSKRVVARFEDLKCNPVEELHKICKELEIPWADSLLKVTRYGKQSIYNNGRGEVKDFDLTPVYNLYEEYFSEFDRFRITLICASWQKKYRYPYVDITLFSRCELQEMFLKDFRFSNRMDLNKELADEKDKLNYFIEHLNDVRQSLQRVRRDLLSRD